ncbi:MAG TPA: sialidase family protein [Chloroflexota bacterium]
MVATGVPTALALGLSVALAAGSTVGPLTAVPTESVTSTAACAALVAQQQALGSVNYPNAEVEPYVAVDPTNSQHLIGAFQEGRWNDGGANALTTVVSTNGGRSWNLAGAQPLFSVCAGAPAGSPGDTPRVSDPWVSFAPDGSAYQVSSSFFVQGPAFGGDSRILVSKSTDGGQSWASPVILLDTPSPLAVNDKESVTADPTDARRVYVVWDQLVSPTSTANPDAFAHTFAFRGPTFLAMTADGGNTWQPAHAIYDPGQNRQTIANQIVVLPDGTLIDGFCLVTSTASQSGRIPTSFAVQLIRSTDHGATWSAPVTISPLIDTSVTTLTGLPVRTGDSVPTWAVNPVSGALYVVWQDGRFAADGHAQIAFAQSTDGGLDWSTPVRINTVSATQAFTPQLSVATDGSLGVSYYDMRHASSAAPGTANYFLVSCTPSTTDCANPAHWSESQLDSQSGFDMTTAPNTLGGGFFVGDYEGLAAVATSFSSLFVLAQPEATQGPTDVFSTTVRR